MMKLVIQIEALPLQPTGFVQSHDVIPEASSTSSDHDIRTHVFAQLFASLGGL